MRHKLFYISIAGALFMAPSAHAQFSAVPDPIQYTVAPETPGPDQPVYIQVAGVGSFVGDATITWQENGQTVDTGVGHTQFSFTTGGIGSATHIHVIINSATKGTMTNDFVFAPSVVDLVWESDTSVPLLYAGKALYSAGSALKVVAFPLVASGRSLVPADQLSYQWSQNDALMPSASGLGRNTFSFDGDEIQSAETVSVDVYLSGAKVGHAEMTVPATDPQILLYNQDPLRGELLDFALPNNFSLDTKEITLRAEPYYFAGSSARAGKLSYTWTLGGQETTGPDSARGLLTLRQTAQGAGSAVVGVSIQNTEVDQFIQAASQTLQMLFGQSGGSSFTSLFGL